MSEQEIEELENFLIQFVIERFSQKNARSVVSVLTSAIPGKEKGVFEFISFLARALIRCIISTKENIYLKDISSVVFAEACVAKDLPPIRFRDRWSERSEFYNQIPTILSEIHRWLIYLEENGKLPGKYERFTGKFVVIQSK